MSRFNTGNPLDSDRLEDLSDNAKNMDLAVNSSADTFQDRLGKSRLTWAGMENQFDADQAERAAEFNADQTERESEFNADQTRREDEFVNAQADKQQRFNLLLANSGYEYLADYAAGIEITEYNQVLRDTAGELWRAAATTNLPYTTDGTGLPEGGAFVAVGDADIRNDLAAGVGAGKGGLLVAGAVIYVDSITDLRAMDTDSLVDGRIVQVRGAGEFTWDSTKGRFRYTDAGKKAKMVGYHENPTILSLPSPLTRVIGEVDGNLYAVAVAAPTDTIYESVDLGQSWQEVQKFTAARLNMEGASLHPTNDGEVLINTVTTLFKSSGWSADPSTAAFTQVLQVNDLTSGRLYHGWGFSVVDNYIMVSEYGVPKPGGFKSYLSTDNGSTFTEVFDLRDHEVGDSNAHNHGCCIDPWHNYRLWQVTGDGENIGVHYSDDLGTTWTRMLEENLPDGFFSMKATSLIATERGIILGSDGSPNGIWLTPRDGNYATAPTMQSIYELRTGNVGGTHIGHKHIRVDGVVYTGFTKEWNDYPPVVTATSVESGETWTVWDNAPPASFRLPEGSGTANMDNIFYAQDTLIIQLTGNFDLVMCPVYEASATRNNTLELVDTGHVLGGASNPDQGAVSVGMLAYAGGLVSAAVGTRADSSGSRSIAVGAESSALGYESIAIGYSSSALNNYGTAVGTGASSEGSRSVAIGQNASTSETGGESIVVGREASSTSFASVVIGKSATSSDGNEAIAIGLSANGGNRAIAIGSGADANGAVGSIAIGRQAGTAVNYGIAVGDDAQVTGNNGIAIGRDAEVAHVNSVAIGTNAVTTNSQQVKFSDGNHIELGNGSNPATPSANNARIYIRDNNGVQQLMVMFGNGVLKVIADDTTT